MPATPASAVDSAKAAEMAIGTLMPIRRAASGFCTTASIALPWRVLFEKRLRSRAKDNPINGIRTCKYDTWTPAKSMPPCVQAIWKPRGSLPKVKRTVLSATMPSATVAISQALEPRRRSTSTP